MLPSIAATGELRHSPVEGIALTDAELDHTLGIPLLRESRTLALYATRAAIETLETGSHLLATTRAFSTIALTALDPGRPMPLLYRDGGPSGLDVEAVAVPGTPPRFAARAQDGDTVALFITDRSGGDGERAGSLAFVPGCAALTPPILDRLASCRAALVDGTFWREDELPVLGLSARTAREMGHLPISGPAGSLEPLAEVVSRGTRVIYVHLNNTNPVLIEDSPERAQVLARGLEVGADGLELEV